MRPTARRQAAAIAQEEHGLSRRRACRLVGISRSLAGREPKRVRDHERLRERLRALAGERRRFGCRRLHELLRREGFKANHKLIERLYREEKLALRRPCDASWRRLLRKRIAALLRAMAGKSAAAGPWPGTGARSPPTNVGRSTSPRTISPAAASSAPPTSRSEAGPWLKAA